MVIIEKKSINTGRQKLILLSNCTQPWKLSCAKFDIEKNVVPYLSTVECLIVISGMNITIVSKSRREFCKSGFLQQQKIKISNF